MIAQILKELREEHGYTKTAVAEAAGIHRETYSAYEKKDDNIPADILSRIALLYNVSMDYLTGYTDTPYAIRGTDDDVETLFYSLEEKDRLRIEERMLQMLEYNEEKHNEEHK